MGRNINSLRRFLFSLASGTTALPNGRSILDDDQDDRPEETLDDEDSHLRANARFVEGASAFVQGETGADVAVEGGDAFRPFVQLNFEETLFEVHRREKNGEDPADQRSDRVQRTRPAARRRIVASEHCGRVDHRVDDVDDAVDDDDGADASAKPIWICLEASAGRPSSGLVKPERNSSLPNHGHHFPLTVGHFQNIIRRLFIH
jgi:hypothetical protein